VKVQPPLLPLVLQRVPRGLRQVLAREGIPFVEHRADCCQGRFVLYDSRAGKPGMLAQGQTLIDVNDLRHGWQGDPFEDLLDERTVRATWRIGGFLISEEIARVDKGQVHRHVIQRLRERVERAGGLWLCLSPYPFPYRSAFNFRFDHDEYDAADFDRVLDAICGHEHATSHFVCAVAHEPYPDAVHRLRGLDVGSHGYLHHTYRSSEENRLNILRGIESLRRLGVEPRGFVAPHGRFHLNLLRALESLGVSHSSEFGLAYDDLPFFPADGQVLQIPIHPICLGLFLEAVTNRNRDSRPLGEDSHHGSSSGRLWFEKVAGEDSSIRRLSLLEAQRGVLDRRQEELVGRTLIDKAVDAATEHFCVTATRRYHAGEPIFFYGHPNGRVGRHPRLLKTLLETVSRFSACWLTSMSEMNDWWRARLKVGLQVTQTPDGYAVLVDQAPTRYPLAADLWRGEHVASVPLGEGVTRLVPAALAFTPRRRERAVLPARVDAPRGLKESLRRYLDWERVTPLDQISARDWRGWMKRTLRRLRD
jgi:peptidoglycan/xylan/chitin deacetylase (PgdA/CDA1 family)